MPAQAEIPAESRSPILGRVLAIGVVALFLMVALGVVWVWRRAVREQEWRQRVTASEPILPAQAR